MVLLGKVLASGTIAVCVLWRVASRSKQQVEKLGKKEENKESQQPSSWTLCTFNVRGFFDHYPRRKRLLRRTLDQVKPSILGLQELMVGSAGQDHFITRCLNTQQEGFKCYSDPSILTYLRACGAPPSYGPVVAVVLRFIIETQVLLMNLPIVGHVVGRIPKYLEALRHWAYAWFKIDLLKYYFALYAPIWGIATAVSPDLLVAEEASIPLRTDIYAEHLGTVQRLKIVFPNGKKAWVVNTHLDSTTSPEGSAIRAAEVEVILRWMEPVLGDVDVTFVLGDNNTLLEEEHLFELWEEAGFVSAHKNFHGYEPSKTWPSGVSCSPFIDLDGNPGCLDYIWFNNQNTVRIHDAGLAGTESCEKDPSLFPSDHFALWARFSFV